MGVPFQNGPVIGRDVFVPLEFIIGERDGAGQGWQMLMDCLAAGRSISLPTLSVAAAQHATRAVGAYATIREQFKMQIGQFEGIEEPLARIGGFTYLMDAARRLTCGAVDAGEKPAVLSAIVKAYLTDTMRTVVNDAMDVQAGCRNLPWVAQHPGTRLRSGADLNYGRGRQYSNPLHDRLWPGCGALPIRSSTRRWKRFRPATLAGLIALSSDM